MAPKKAPKKAAKKSPTHAADNHAELDASIQEHHKKHGRDDKKHGDKKHDDKQHREHKDLRRAYEHLGRLTALEKTLTGRTVNQIKTLTTLAQNALLADDPKSAADLLRAAEHLAFGSLAQNSRATRLSETLEAALNLELEHLTEKAAEHWEKHDGNRPAAIAEIYTSMLAVADAAHVKGAYRRALEFARGAEALAHVRGLPPHAAAQLDQTRALKLAADEDD
ncbi:MAG: hypothetical protein HIU91_06975 [Acidobacteria bacterium]|nr:hypothetical protein [Acidobacteriota bacterium]